MEKSNTGVNKKYLLGGVVLIGIALIFPLIVRSTIFEVIFTIRRAIHVGDSGHLILASAYICFIFAIQTTLLYLGSVLSVYFSSFIDVNSKLKLSAILIVIIFMLHEIGTEISQIPWEPISTIFALIIALIIFVKLFYETYNFLHVSIVSIQVFYAFQWLNIMPLFSTYYMGQSDIAYSIKIAGLYLEASNVLNFAGFAFFLPFMCSAFITATLFISYSRNINMIKVNYEKEKEIQSMKNKILENRIYKEVKSLVHDLKTPLVTIRGLNSLLAVSKNSDKLEEYSGRIDSSVEKMTEMISSFLFETSRQRLRAIELISYIRAQLPLEDETIKFELKISEHLPDIYVNKIRMARAVINILENAILVPHRHEYKIITFEAKQVVNGLQLIVQDNGIGIDENILQQIWEVGFSTNNTSGLGLPFAKQIIEDNEGNIEISSKVGQGTTVTIILPLAEDIIPS
jgi:signal transduction histidine kinase